MGYFAFYSFFLLIAAKPSKCRVIDIYFFGALLFIELAVGYVRVSYSSLRRCVNQCPHFLVSHTISRTTEAVVQLPNRLRCLILVSQIHAVLCPEKPVNPSQTGPCRVLPCAGSLTGCSNQVAQTVDSQNTFYMKSQSEVNSNEAAQHSNQDHHTLVLPALGPNALQDSQTTSQTLQGSNFLPSPNYGSIQMQQTQMNMQHSRFQQPQDGGNATINTNWRNPQIKNFSRSHDSGKRERFNSRFQKSQFHPVVNAKGNFKSSKWKERKVNNHKGGKTAYTGDATKQERVECKRSITLNYTEQEIQQWCEARRKNYPTKSNIEKKFSEKQTDPGAVERDSKTWRQQLKDILAKQAELGVEVAEIPQDYLSDSDKPVFEEKKVLNKKGRIRHKHGNRGSHSQENRFAKKQRIVGDRGSSEMSVMKNRRPTLLQKLLTLDVKRDKSHLLQAFRFMLKNSFFKDWPDKQLEFPSITVTNMGFESHVVRESSPYEENDVSGVPRNNVAMGLVGSRHNTADDKNKVFTDNVEDDAEVEEMVNRCAGATGTREQTERSEDEEGEIID
ncbi:hypothetical protein NE237_010963 [Protea cynaroides]|uniref:FMR1-interacting protein 1 conserved domain-containing protein n=1 Tax=Protea cynaroides TaxID=273540 RepID=A0A9Q0L0B3_9MAGN|nr:hypothetical protein NE237_010963 [Protea cynaroides]